MSLLRALQEVGIPLDTFSPEKVDAVLILGSQLGRDDEKLVRSITNATLPCFVLSTMEDPAFPSFYKYEVGTEEGVLGLLAKALWSEKDPAFTSLFEGLDEGYLSAECNLGEEEAQALASALKEKRIVCVLGADLEHHKRAGALAQWFSVLSSLVPMVFVMAGATEKTASPKTPTLPPIPEELESYDGTIAYACPAKSKEEEGALEGSLQFSIAAKIQHGDEVEVASALGVQRRTFQLNATMKGTVALLPFASVPAQFRYVQSTIKKVG